MLEMREVFSDLDPAQTHEVGQTLTLREIYAPADHEAVLDPERTLVIGDRGVGKSFWTDVLLRPELRPYIEAAYPRIRWADFQPALGFASAEGRQYPSAEVLDDLERAGFAIEAIWRTVFLSCAQVALGLEVAPLWRERVAWVAADAERAQAQLRELDELMLQRGTGLMVVFDALDRLGDNWSEINRRTRGLLRVALGLRTHKRIKPKIFMRPDQAKEPEPFSFPDSSKLLNGSVNLIWSRLDLYGLAFARLANDARSSLAFEALLQRTMEASLVRGDGFVDLPRRLKDDEALQEVVFRNLAGAYMGSDRRRGKTYTWLHTHLADAHGRVGPRTFLVALRGAAKHRPAPDSTAIDHLGLGEGVKLSSVARVRQLKEDHPWLDLVLAPLVDLKVPCHAHEFYERWSRDATISAIERSLAGQRRQGPIGWDRASVSDHERQELLLLTMIVLGMIERRADGRINMPDIYRVAARMMRKGGVTPVNG